MHSDFKEKINKLGELFGIKIEQQNLFKRALTHSSYTREKEINSLENYERLEFLGDAVLKLCVSDILYKNYPDYSEGELTKIRSIIVSDKNLAKIGLEMGLGSLIILGHQEEKMGGRKRMSIVACTFEAILGAYYLSGKYKELSLFLERIFKESIKTVDKNFEKFNAKAVLQEYTQSKNKIIPEYKVIEEEGPEHNKVFVIEVSYMGSIIETGRGKTKKEAEQDGAYKACIKLGAIN